MKNKKGVSGVITTIILIVIALAAIGLAWTFIKAIIDSGTEDTGEDLFNALKTCQQNDNSFEICGEDYKCDVDEFDALDGKCCPGNCEASAT